MTMALSPRGPGEAAGEPAHLRNVVVIWAILSVIGIVAVVFLLPLLLQNPASDAATFDNTTMVVFTALAVPVALFVWVFIGYSLLRFRVRGRPGDDGPPLRASAAVQIGWLSITGILCLFLVIWGLVGLYQETATPADASNVLVVDVTGQQWKWTFSYPQYNVSSSTLELQVGRPVQFNVTSLDVLHGFAIQALGVRVDANPDENVTASEVTPNQTGTFDVRCVELCGLYHSLMNASAQVVPADQFRSWVSSQGGSS
jgi:cytochrome c oxidase subunit 2